jgi:putative tricarboxylic transport membrane protein
MRTLSTLISTVPLLLSLVGLANDTRAAEEYPVKPIMYIVSAEAGSDLDILTRPFVQKASSVLGKPIIIVNKPGAGSSIAYREIHDAKPDGYTIGVATATIISNKLQGILPYDYHEFTLLGTYYVLSNQVFASTKSQPAFKTIAEVISFAKSRPGEIKLATGAIGQTPWLGAMSLQAGTGVEFNIIPQPGVGGFIAAQVAGGHAHLGVAGLPSMKSQMDAGNVRLLALLQTERIPEYKDIPTMRNLGYDITNASTAFAMGPAKMPKDIADKLTNAFEIAATDAEYQKFVRERFITPFYLHPDKLGPYLDEQTGIVRKIMEKAGILKTK